MSRFFVCLFCSKKIYQIEKFTAVWNPRRGLFLSLTARIIKVNIRNVQPPHVLGTILFDLLVHIAPLVFRFCGAPELLRPKVRNIHSHGRNMFSATCRTCS